MVFVLQHLLLTEDIEATDEIVGENGVQSYESSSGYHSNTETSSNAGESSSDIEIENQMLKKEIASLNHEIQAVILRSKEAQEGHFLSIFCVCVQNDLI